MIIIITSSIAWWSSYYGNHQLLSVTIRFLHLAAIVLGGGAGLWTDWQVMKAARGKLEKEAVMKWLSRAHAYVVPWMAVLALTGVLMMAADTATFFSSKVFWAKIVLVFLLVSNGFALVLLEGRARQWGIDSVWSKLVLVSCMSALLWQTTLFAGTLLTVAA